MRGICSIHSRRAALRFGAAIVAMATASVANAQTADGTASDDDGAIVVTALKQGAELLDTSATVKVVGQDDLVTANISNARDLSGAVPGFVFMQGVVGGSASIRGLGSNSADPSIESSVASFNDGIYLGHTRDFTTPLYDLQQIEFVAGTQSTVLGRNTSLGAVTITSRRPGRNFAADVTAGYTTELGAYNVRAGMDVPLGSDFAVRLAGYFNDEHGYTRNAFLNRNEESVREVSGRAVLDGDLSDSVRLTAIYQRDSRRGKGQYIELLNDPDGLGEFFSTVVLGLPAFDGVANDQTLNGSERLNPADPAAQLPFDNQDSDRATVIVEVETAGGGQLTAQTAYVNRKSSQRTDQDYTPALILDLLDDESNEVFSQELRFNSPTEKPFSFGVGVYYYHNNYSLRRRIESDLGENLDAQSAITTDSFSIFGSSRYRLSDQFSVIAGIRYNLEDKRASYDISGTLAAPIAPITLPNTTSNEVDYNFGLEFNPNEDLLIYATYARGSKNGGFQSIPDDISLATYGTEVTRSFEIGAKYDLGSMGSIEFAAFDTRVDDFQAARLVTPIGFTLPVTQIANVGARTTGAEATVRLKPARGLEISSALTYTDARFTDELLNEVAPGVFETEITDGMRLVRAPRWSGRVNVNYTTSVGSSLELSFNGVARYQSDADLQFRASNPGVPIQKEHAVVDLEARLGNPESGWSLAVIGNNLTNVRYATFASDWLLAGLIDPTATPPYYGRRNRPRTVTFQASIRF